MVKSIEYKGIYRVTYFSNERADNIRIDDIYLRPKVFEGVIENFYPAGKCVFYNEVTEQILVMQYECINNICPIDGYKNNKEGE